MDLNSTNIIFKRLEEVTFPKEITPVYNLIKEYPERIHFVKDHNGVQNVLFLSTEDSANDVFEFPYFASFLPITSNKEAVYNYVVEYAPQSIYKTTKNFLETSNEKLYVGIGFLECQVTNEDYFEILYLLEDTKCNIVDAFVSLRRFPEWYSEEADYPFYILKEKEYLGTMAEKEKEHLLNLKHELLGEMNDAVLTNNEKRFNEICKDIKIISEQITKNEI